MRKTLIKIAVLILAAMSLYTIARPYIPTIARHETLKQEVCARMQEQDPTFNCENLTEQSARQINNLLTQGKTPAQIIQEIENPAPLDLPEN
ncbi:hypothetical protein HMPREF1862_01796 [Varibaculum cambriense]|uniref:Uncharacterized protein n=1 Tax=Varibaculum cambriense TaxID=184870 RepID=A0AB34WWY1_9ACTO|nr:hypothetical protein [Varibaculum cambriense]KXB79423.1 hypothetical protein HMPREF1862_01796 [Varibaculum cambriense]